jgi:hypothetical protein
MQYHRLTRLQRATLVLFTTFVINWILRLSTGYVIVGGDLLDVFFLVVVVFMALSLVPAVAQRIFGKGKSSDRH